MAFFKRVPLVTVTGGGITTGVSIVRMDTGATVTGLLGIDVAPPRVSYGSDGAIQAWNPANGLARCVVLTSGSATTNAGLTCTVNGYDIYGNPLQCRASTRKGTPCQRMPLAHNGYCPSHQHLAETEELETPLAA